MLSQYFGFQEEPFGATPDPRWLYRSATHREALASLRYGFYSNRGFTALIAPPGLGKTTLLFQFLHDIRNSARIVFLFDTQCEPLGLLRYILRALGITPAINGDEMHVQLEDILVREARAGRTVVVVVDEAHNLSDEALEMLRLLTNYETPRAKLLHIVLSGQPLLADMLMKPSMEQLRQRVSTIGLLEPFSMDETTAYIRHRLEQAGYRGAPLFRKDALRRIMVASHGIPRIINNLCFNALSLCCEQKRNQVDGRMAAEAIAIQELDPESRKKITDRWEVAAERSLQPEQSIQPEQLLRPEKPIQPEQPTQAEEPKPVLRRLMVPAAAVLLVASGIGLLSLSARWQPWSRLTGYIQSLDTKVLSASFPRSSKPNISTRIVAAPSSKPSPLNTNDLSASIPAPATANIGKVTITKPPMKAKPSPAKALSPPIPAPAPANTGKVTVAEPPSKTTPSATKALSPPIPAPAPANTGKVTVAEPPSGTTPSATTAAIRNPVGGIRGSAESPHVVGKVAHAGLPTVTGTAPAGSYGKVAPAGIPGVVKGTVPAKMAVAPVPAEMLPKPTEQSNPAEEGTPNCGGVIEMPCPKLQIRPTQPPD